MGCNDICGVWFGPPGINREEVEAFFGAYARALGPVDIDGIVSLYHAPCFKVHGDGSIQCLPTREALRSFFSDLTAKYRVRGLGSGSFRDLELVPMGAQAVLASLTWDLQHHDHSSHRQFRRSYNLLRQGTDWLILVTTAHRD